MRNVGYKFGWPDHGRHNGQDRRDSGGDTHTVPSAWSVALRQRHGLAAQLVSSGHRRRCHATVSIWRSLRRWQKPRPRHFLRSETSAQYGTNPKYTRGSRTQVGGLTTLTSNSLPHRPEPSPALPAICLAFWRR